MIYMYGHDVINLMNVINRPRIFVQINIFTNPIKEMKCK